MRAKIVLKPLDKVGFEKGDLVYDMSENAYGFALCNAIDVNIIPQQFNVVSESGEQLAVFPALPAVPEIDERDLSLWIDNGCPDTIELITVEVSGDFKDSEESKMVLTTNNRIHIAWQEKKLPPLFKKLAEAIDKKEYKVQFGLEQQGHIPTIEAMLKDGGNYEYTWKKIGKAIGWCHKTACYWYLDYVLAKQNPAPVDVPESEKGLHQHLFNYMSNNHDLILTQDEMAGIINAVELDAKYQKAENSYFELL